MKAIILSAGRGSRLMPWTAFQPKCLIEVNDEETILGLQLRALASAGVSSATVVVGFEADRVESFLRWSPVPGIRVETVRNPFFAVADNLVSAWMAREHMGKPFVLLNGDTVFEPAVARRLLSARPAPVTLVVDRKTTYDDDDMKVSLEGTRLRAVGKALAPDVVDAESIGMMLFRGSGPHLYRQQLDEALRGRDALSAWHLAVIDQLAARTRVETVCVEGLDWWEIDSPEDLGEARAGLRRSVHAA